MSGAPLRDAALEYAARGWQVLPLHGTEGGSCTCGKEDCQSPGKHPRTSHGLKDACSDPETVSGWWERWPEANIGIRTGEDSGLLVLDVDSQEAAEGLKGKIPPGALEQTTGRGYHVLFKHPGFKVKNSTSEIGPDIDVRGDGGYIVAPPSLHANGKRYTWKSEGEPGDAPEWLLDFLKNGKRAEGQPAPTICSSDERTRAYVAAAIQDEHARVRAAQTGSRNATLNAAAFSLGTLAHLGADEADCETALVSAAIVAGLAEDEGRRTFRSGWSAGAQEPREMPDRAMVPGDARPWRPTEAPIQPDAARRLEVLTAAELLTVTPERPEWIAEPLVARSCISDLVAGPKVGKSTLALALAAAVTEGRPFVGKHTTRTGVLYLTEERGPTFRAALERVGLIGDGLRIILRRAGAGWKWADVVEAATAEALDHGAGLLVIDSLADWAALQGDAENSSGAVLEALRPVQAAADAGLAVLLVRHDRKGPAAELGEAGRGSNATAGACDILMGLRKTIGAGHENRRRLDYVSRFDGLPPSQVIEWQAAERTYVLLGTEADIQHRACRESLLTILPADDPATEAELLGAYAEDERPARATLQRVIRELIDADEVERSGEGKRGKPYRYRRAER